MAQKWFRRALLLALLGGIVAGAVIWVTADSGTKAVDLGAGLLATGLFGGILVFLERELAAKIDLAKAEVQATASTLPPTPDRAEVEATAVPSSGRFRQFTAVFAGWIRDPKRVDAGQLRLRVLCDGEYFQFFTGVVSGPAMHAALRTGDIGAQRFRRGCVQSAVRDIQGLIGEGLEPLGDPLDAVEILVDTDRAERFARRSPDKPLEEGEEVGAWVG